VECCGLFVNKGQKVSYSQTKEHSNDRSLLPLPVLLSVAGRGFCWIGLSVGMAPDQEGEAVIAHCDHCLKEIEVDSEIFRETSHAAWCMKCCREDFHLLQEKHIPFFIDDLCPSIWWSDSTPKALAIPKKRTT
jgi:hypothetical protein